MLGCACSGGVGGRRGGGQPRGPDRQDQGSQGHRIRGRRRQGRLAQVHRLRRGLQLQEGGRGGEPGGRGAARRGLLLRQRGRGDVRRGAAQHEHAGQDRRVRRHLTLQREGNADSQIFFTDEEIFCS